MNCRDIKEGLLLALCGLVGHRWRRNWSSVDPDLLAEYPDAGLYCQRCGCE